MKTMLRGSSALILEWAYHEAPAVFGNARLAGLFQNCLFHHFIAESKKSGRFSQQLNLQKNLQAGFEAFAKDCEQSLRVLKYGGVFQSEIRPERRSFLQSLSEVQEFSQEFPFFFERDDKNCQAAV
jgi:hypothetical protein